MENNQAKEAFKLEPGDIFDEDSGRFLGSIDLTDKSNPLLIKNTLPVALSVYHDGYWYVFHPVKRAVVPAEEVKEIEDSWNEDEEAPEIKPVVDPNDIGSNL